MDKGGKITLIVLSVVLVLFLGGLSSQFFKSDDSVSGFAVNEINVQNVNAFSYGHVCARNSDCKSNICSNKKCVDCLSDRNCKEGYYCNASKNCVRKKQLFETCGSDRECTTTKCYDGVCVEACDAENPCTMQLVPFKELISYEPKIDIFKCSKNRCIPQAVNGYFGGNGDVSCIKSGRTLTVNSFGFPLHIFNDMCTSSNALVRFTCNPVGGGGNYENTYYEVKSVTCKPNTMCSKGACVKSPVANRIKTGFTNLFNR